MRAFLSAVESVSEISGKIVRWVSLALVLVLVWEVAARYVFGAPTIWAHALSTMLGAALFALGWAYTHYHHGHVRVDVLYARVSDRKKAAIDVIGWLIFFLPLLGILIYQSIREMAASWAMHEVITTTYWYPPAAPIRTLVVIGLVLFGMQGVVQFIRDLRVLLERNAHDRS